jgi:hypothetical protein
VTSSSQTERDPRAAEVRELTWDLACASGALSEIATCWRRSFWCLPELPSGLPLRLQDSARRIGADARSLADAGQAPGPAAELAERFAEFRNDFDCARDMTRAPGSADAGDALLWDSADAALNRAGARLLHLILELATAGDPVPAQAPA